MAYGAGFDPNLPPPPPDQEQQPQSLPTADANEPMPVQPAGESDTAPPPSGLTFQPPPGQPYKLAPPNPNAPQEPRPVPQGWQPMGGGLYKRPDGSFGPLPDPNWVDPQDLRAVEFLKENNKDKEAAKSAAKGAGALLVDLERMDTIWDALTEQNAQGKIAAGTANRLFQLYRNEATKWLGNTDPASRAEQLRIAWEHVTAAARKEYTNAFPSPGDARGAVYTQRNIQQMFPNLNLVSYPVSPGMSYKDAQAANPGKETIRNLIARARHTFNEGQRAIDAGPNLYVPRPYKGDDSFARGVERLNAEGTAAAAAAKSGPRSVEDLNTMSLEELKALARQRGLKVPGD